MPPDSSSGNATNNVGWLGIDQAAAANKINTLADGSLATTGWYAAKDASTSDTYWVPFEINDPSYQSYVTERIKAASRGTAWQTLQSSLPSDGAVTAQWFIDQISAKAITSQDLSTWMSDWGAASEEPSYANDNSGIDDNDQFLFTNNGSFHRLFDNFDGGGEFLVGNDIDNSNPVVQEEQQHWAQWLMENYGFDGFRIDAASNIDSSVLSKIAEAVKSEKASQGKKYTDSLNYIESYSGNQTTWENANGNPQLSYDSSLFYTLRNTLGQPSSSQSMTTLSTNSIVNRSGSNLTGTSNWSFVQNHDQEKNIINQMMLDNLGISSYVNYGSAATAKSFANAYNNSATASTGRKQIEQNALDEYWREMNSAIKADSTGKNYAPYNVVGSYAYLLTNRGTVPTVYYGDMYRTDGAYMSTETPYYASIVKLLSLRSKYATGDQQVQNLSVSTGSNGSDLVASVRTGTDRSSGIAVVLGNNPSSKGTVTINMGKNHAHQAYTEALGLDPVNGSSTFITDKNGRLTISVEGQSTAQVHGILDVLIPVSTDFTYKDTTECTHGAIGDLWKQLGGSTGKLGMPTSCEISYEASSNSSGQHHPAGVYQQFDHGEVVWDPINGVHAIIGKIFDAWSDQNGLNGLGLPVTDEHDGLKNGGAAQEFQSGQIHWSSTTGAHTTKGAIQAYWATNGWENGWLGYPTGDELKINGGVSQTFQGGTIWWNEKTGETHAVHGGILTEYATQKWEQGDLGYPVTDEHDGLKNGGAAQEFQSGQIHWSSTTGAHTTKGAIQAYWATNGWENGWLGYPTGDELKINGGVSQTFQGGTIWWNEKTGETHAVHGGILTEYATQKWEQGDLGYPVTDEIVTSYGARQDFGHGTITWHRASGALTVALTK